MDPYSRHRSDPRVTARDAGLRRVHTLTRLVGVGAVGAVGLLAAYVAQAKPGYSTSSSPTARVAGSGAGAKLASQTVPAAAAIPRLSTGGGSESLTPPPSAPEPVVTSQPVTPPPVVSGGS